MFILDTNFLIDLEEELAESRLGKARKFLGAVSRQGTAISAITLGELAVGIEDEILLRQFVSKFRIISLKPEIALVGGKIQRLLARSGKAMGENDIWLAATALYYSSTLVSNDRAFKRVTGLKVRNY